MRPSPSSLRAVVGLAGAQLRHYRLRSLLAAGGVTLAVLLVVLLAGLGYGVTTAGAEGLSWIDRDLWISAGPLGFAPGAVGGVQNPLLDAHAVADRIEARNDVRSAEALAFQTVYVGTNRSDFVTLVGVGGTGNGSTREVAVSGGPGFSSGDLHYANGTYAGPMSGEVIVDERTAALLDVAPGDTLYIGGTIASAREHAFTVVGVTSAFSTFLGTATVTLHLSELQELTGTTGTDPAALVTVSTEPGADVGAVATDLEREYPSYEVRTNREQLRAVLGNQAMVLASTATLVVLAILVGATLVANVLALLVYHQRAELAALKAAGVSSGTLVGLVAGQGIGLAAIGGAVGVTLAPLVAGALNGVIADLTGFAALVKTPPWVLAGGMGLALAMGVAGAVVAGLRVARIGPLSHLER